MSNFICSECGMTNIDCGREGYKTPREIELEKKLDKAELVLKTIALNLTTDPADMRVAIKDWCCDQECLNLVNKYFEEKGKWK